MSIKIRCNQCGADIASWENVAHWQTHNPGRPHFKSAPRDEVTALFAVDVERAHAEALAENIAHDAAMTMAVTLPAELLPLLGARARQMPRTLRNRIDHARHMIVVPPHRHA
jgi:hypothetical protein